MVKLKINAEFLKEITTKWEFERHVGTPANQMEIDISEVFCEILNGIKMASNTEYIMAAIFFS